MITTCRNNTWTMRATFLLLHGQRRCFITPCFHISLRVSLFPQALLLFALIVLQITMVRQCFLQSTDIVRCFFMMMIKMPLQFYSYGNADFVDGMNQEVFTKSSRVCQRIFVCVIFFVSFKSLVFVFHWNALC